MPLISGHCVLGVLHLKACSYFTSRASGDFRSKVETSSYLTQHHVQVDSFSLYNRDFTWDSVLSWFSSFFLLFFIFIVFLMS